MITPSTTSNRHQAQSPSNNPSWLSLFKPSEITSRKTLHILSKILTVLQTLNPSGTQINFPTQQPSGVPTFPLMECQAKNLLTYLLVTQVIILVEVHQFLLVCIPFLCQVLHQPHCLQIFQVITNDVSPVTDGFMDGYLRSYFTK